MQRIDDFFDRDRHFIRIELSVVKGSSPREASTAMYVSEKGCFGTIGGGTLEYMAIDEAHALLRQGADAKRMSVPLGPEIGQCCGGFVEINLNRMTMDDISTEIQAHQHAVSARPSVFIFGAGHVGRALAKAFDLLPVKAILVDSRAEELAMADGAAEQRLTPLPEAEVRSAPAGSAFLILTHDHALDFMIAVEALAKSDATYVGMIGSKTKRASFVSWCGRNVEPPVNTDGLICPMGSQGSKDKRPEVIAAFVAAEVIGVLTDEQEVEDKAEAKPELVGGSE